MPLTLTRVAEIWNTDNIKYTQGRGSIGPLVHCWWESKMDRHLGRQFGNFLQDEAFCNYIIQ